MLILKNIIKNYRVGDSSVEALRGVELAFRDSEFVSVLGPSGCGKTTLLNIIGGLDRYTSGDLTINGRSTKEFRDSDWDAYRNHSIGFVFQSYNLIAHQTVLSNVELALTLSGVSKHERRRRAQEALEKVGLGDQLKKRPNQMSGGQMQRVAIARALVNDPDILLADEPTGALDSETSLQVMELLREISKDRLIIMVTHNGELAEKYSTRIVRLLDGRVIGDTAPFSPPAETINVPVNNRRKGKKSMSFFTALSLSFNNLMTKRARTLLTSFAGSIGIIGIALILALSTGVKSYIDDVQRDTLGSYPITIESEESALSSMMSLMADAGTETEEDGGGHGDDAVYSNPQMYKMFNAIFADTREENNLTAFKSFLDREMDPQTGTTGLDGYASTIQYQYDVDLNCYVKNPDGDYVSCDIADAFASVGQDTQGDETLTGMLSTQMSAVDLWTELLPGQGGETISTGVRDSYELLYGEWPQTSDEIVLIVDQDNEISDIAFYALGLVPQDEVTEIITAAMRGEEIPVSGRRIDYADVCGTSLKLVKNSDYYSDTDGDGVWSYIGDDNDVMRMVIKNARELRITGVIRSSQDGSMGSGMQGSVFGYTSALTEQMINDTNDSAVVKAQTAAENENLDILTGRPFVMTEEIDPDDAEKADRILMHFASLTDAEKTKLYTDILSDPGQETVDREVSEYLAEYDTREKLEQLAAGAYGMDVETMKSYLASYEDEELREMVETQLEKTVRARYVATAEEQIRTIGQTPSEDEMAALVARITVQLTSREARIGYVASDWQQSTSMDAQTLMGYLSALPEQPLAEAVQSVASRQAAQAYASMAGMDATAEQRKVAAAFDAAYLTVTDIDTLAGYYDLYMPSKTSGSSLSANLEALGVLSLDTPSAINIYAESFEAKDAISGIISDYNATASEEEQIGYTDYVALLMSGITDIINAISYGLIAFVSISLIVSSIMIGIITYISVLERTKEIGILRSIGASKHDVSLVFNAETMIVGLAAGVIGIGLSLLLCIPISLLIHALSGVTAINAFLEPLHCVALILISMFLTIVAGVIPSRIAAKKDPVEALRTE